MHGVDESRVKLWIEALRSGEFRQANGHLETFIEGPDGIPVKGNCCLGVAMHVALRNGWQPGVLNWGPTAMHPGAANWFGFQNTENFTDPYLGEFQGLGDGRYGDGGMTVASVYCVEANDDLNWSFEQIADALEARYITPSTPVENIDKES